MPPAGIGSAKHAVTGGATQRRRCTSVVQAESGGVGGGEGTCMCVFARKKASRSLGEGAAAPETRQRRCVSQTVTLDSGLGRRGAVGGLSCVILASMSSVRLKLDVGLVVWTVCAMILASMSS